MRFICWLILLWPLAAAAGPGFLPGFLMSTEELAARLAAANPPALIDAENAESYQRAHIPGALNLYYLDLEDAEENAKTGLPIHPNLGASKFGALGIRRDTEVVVYDSGNGRGASAVRYILNFLGHERVSLLDGGFRKWLKEGRPLTQATRQPVKVIYVAQPRNDWALKTEALKTDVLAGRAAVMLDGRSIAEYTGKDAGGAKQAGHIPGAKSLPWNLLSGELVMFKDAAAMRQVLAEHGVTPDQDIITYCNPGLGRSTFLQMALESLGYDKVKVYPGSWNEWASDPAHRIER